MNDLTTAKENAMTAIDMLKESVLTALVELGGVDEYISANNVTVGLGLEGMKKGKFESPLGSDEIINALLWLLAGDERYVERGGGKPPWKISKKGLEKLGITE